MNISFRKQSCTAVPARQLPVGALSVLAFCTTLIAARWGIGLSPDSMVYIGVARSLLDGNGVTYLNDVGELSPVNHYPPLYPFMIAGLALTGMDPLVAAKWMNAGLFAVNIVLVASMVFASTCSWRASWAAAFFFFASFPMAQVHSMAWSEPLFLFLGFSGLLFLARYLEEEKRWALYASSSAIALNCLARYAGVSFVWTGLLGIFLTPQRNGKKRLADGFVFAALSCLSLTAWACRSLWLAGSAANRTFGFHPPSGEDMITALNSICLWIFPPGILGAPTVARAAALGTAVLLVWRLTRHPVLPARQLPRLAGAFLFAYGIFLLMARSLFDSAIPFDTRILAPAYVAAMILVICALAHASEAKPYIGSWQTRLALSAFVTALAAVQTTNAAAWWKQAYDNGVGYTGLSWRNSEALKFVNTTAQATPVFTNVPDVIYMLTGRRTTMIPRIIDPKSRLRNNRFDSEVAFMRQRLEQSRGVVAYFHAPQRLWYLPSAEELRKASGLRLLAVKKDGYIYELDHPR